MRSPFDAIVVGAGPAGSVCAYRLATEGARVLLADKERFPRDKPCGGALTVRALRQLPFSIEGVVEEAADRIQFRLGYGWKFERRTPETLLALTQRRHLDLALAERAAAAGSEFRDGVRVADFQRTSSGVSALVGGERVEATTLIDATGANGTAAAGAGLRGGELFGVGLEGNAPYEAVAGDGYRGRVVLELGAVPGGYGWIFPKGDHLNVGVGGWQASGPMLRGHLRRLCSEHGIDPGVLEDVRGARLPVRGPDGVVARGRALSIGDAAGLVDPLSGEGIFEALLSARLASTAVLELLAGEAEDLSSYGRALNASLAPISAASWAAKHAVDLHPRLTFTLARFPPAWGGIVRLLRGEVEHPDAEPSSLARFPLRAIQTLGQSDGASWRRWRSPGRVLPSDG